MTWPQYLRGECVYDGSRVKLTRREADFLLPLLLNRGRPVPKYEIVEAVYTEDEIERLDATDSPTKMVDVYVCKLRKKLPGLIETQRSSRCGFGAMRGGYMACVPDGEAFTPLTRTEVKMTVEQRLLMALHPQN